MKSRLKLPLFKKDGALYFLLSSCFYSIKCSSIPKSDVIRYADEPINFDGNNDAFYSRRIRLSASNEIESIYAGLRAVGRYKKLDFATLVMQVEDLESGKIKNLSILKLKRQIGETNGYIGAIITNDIRVSENGTIAYRLDGQIEYFTNDFIKFAFAKSNYLPTQNIII